MKITTALLILFLNINLIFAAAIKNDSYNDDSENDNSKTEVYYLAYTAVVTPIQFYVYLTPYINEDDYKNTNIYNTFKAYFDEQRAKDNFVFYGESTVLFNVDIRTNILLLNVLNLAIDETATIAHAIVNSKSDKLTTYTYKPTLHTYDDKMQTVTIYFVDDFLPRTLYSLTMKFVGSISDKSRGFFKTSYVNREGQKSWVIAAANFQGPGARQIFPCWDKPNIQTHFMFAIKHHQKYKALSNVAITEQVSTVEGNDMVWTYFDSYNYISFYHIAIVLANLEHIVISNDRGGIISMLHREQMTERIKFAQKVAVSVTSYFPVLLNISKYSLKVDHVVIPGFRDEGLGSLGLILYSETDIIYDEFYDPIGCQIKTAFVVARKVVYEAISIVDQSSWSYIWLNEGIATFLGVHILSEIMPNSYSMYLFVVQFLHESLRLNDYYDMPLVSNINETSDIASLFSFTHYVKAPVLIYTLSHITHRFVFMKSVGKYIQLYKFRFFSSRDNTFQRFLSILRKEIIRADIKSDLVQLNNWATQKRYPVLNVTRISFKNEIEISLSKKYFKPYPQNTWIHVIYVPMNNYNMSHESRDWLSSEKSIYVTNISKDVWILVNLHQTGYYRVYYDKYNWNNILKTINTTYISAVPTLNRAQLIDDAYYFLVRGELDFAIFKNFTSYLLQEREYIPWYSIIKIMEEISAFLLFPQSKKVKEHFQIIFESVLKILYPLGYKEANSGNIYTISLRQETARWTCILESQECRNFATLSLLHHMNELKHRRSSLLPYWKEWTYCNGLIKADSIIWNKVFIARKTDKKILEFLACVKNHTIIVNYMNQLKWKYFEEQDRIIIFHSIIAKHAKNNLVLDYILQNFTNVVPSEIKTSTALIDIINHIYSKEQLDMVSDFTKNYVFKIIPHVLQKIEIRLSEIKKQIKYFESFLKVKDLSIE
ncbi:hypothetical protein P5V15_001628 [Pogonomyrmex californicus]